MNLWIKYDVLIGLIIIIIIIFSSIPISYRWEKQNSVLFKVIVHGLILKIFLNVFQSIRSWIWIVMTKFMNFAVHWEKSSKSKNDRGVQVNFVRVESFGLGVEVREPNVLHKYGAWEATYKWGWRNVSSYLKRI